MAREGILVFAVVLMLSSYTEGQNDACSRSDGGFEVRTSLSGTLKSPDHPAVYPPNQACSWKISVSEGHRIVVSFDVIDIEEQSSCSYDYLQIRDGDSTTAPSIDKYCGTEEPSPVTSTGNNMVITFRSDEAVGGSGFKLFWNSECLPGLFSCDYAVTCIDPALECDLNQDCNDWTDEGQDCITQGLGAYANFSTAGCSSTIDNITEAGSLSTPNYPSFYLAGMACSWSLTAAAESDGRHPVLLASFADPFNVSCGTGSVQITTSDESGAVDSTAVCGDRPGVIPIGAENGQTMNLAFTPSDLPIGQGYAVQWTLCPADSLACPETGDCFAPETGVLSCPVVTTVQSVVTQAAGDVTTDGGMSEGVRTATTSYTGATRPGMRTSAASTDNSTMDTEGTTACYVCEGTSAECLTGRGLDGSSTVCGEEEACWVERVGEGDGVSYKRSCQPACSDHWQYETCMTANGQPKVCKLCCTEDRCNTHVLTGHDDPRAPGQNDESDAEGTVPSLGIVTVLAIALCANILSLTG